MIEHFPWLSSDNQTHLKVCALVSIYSPLRWLVMGPSPSPHTSICPAHVFGLALKEREGTSENSNIKECFKPLDDLFFLHFFEEYCFSKRVPATTVSNSEATQVRAQSSVEPFKTYHERNSGR